MYKIEVHNRITQIISIYIFIGLLHSDGRSKFYRWVLKVVNIWVALYIPLSVFAGSFLSDDKVESIFSIVGSLIGLVISVRLFYFLSKKHEILNLVNTLGVVSIRDQIYYSLVVGAVIVSFVLALPTFSLGKEFPLNMYFPNNYKDSEFDRWIAAVFIALNQLWFIFFLLIDIVVWYLMMCCAIKYQILGNEFRNIGMVTSDVKREAKKNVSLSLSDDAFLKELIAIIKNYQSLRETIVQLTICFSNLFFMQIATSGITICGAVYNLAFNSMQNPLQYYLYGAVILHALFDIFLITYFGNEIKFWSSNLSYCLFECNWMDQSRHGKQCMIIFMELLKQPQVLLVGKLYRLDLEIFKKILNFAYSMFNVLKNLK